MNLETRVPAEAGRPLKISVITVCRNAVDTIETTIQSVLWQDYLHCEYVVIDGMSTDGTWPLLQKYRERIAVLAHEPDTGIYNAMNKGIQRSTGDVIVFMNANDYFASPAVLSRVAATFAREPGLDIVYGDYIVDFGFRQEARQQVEQVGALHFLKGLNLLHQSMFCRRQAFQRIGLFDESLAITADRDWNIRALVQAKMAHRHIPVVMCVFDANGACNTKPAQRAAEVRAIIRRRYGRPARAYWEVYRRWAALRDPVLFRLRHRDFRPPRVIRQLLGRDRS